MENDPYARLASRYDGSVERWAGGLRKAALTLCPPSGSLAILDVACGTGAQLALYGRPGCTLTGIDTSPAMLEVARRKLGDTADLRCEDATRMSFADASFDLVTLVLALHEMPPDARPRVLAECRRVTKPGGRILVLDFHCGPYPFVKGWLYKLLTLWMEAGAGREHFAHYRDFIARKGLDALVADACIPVKRRFVFDSGAAVIYVLSP